MRAKFAIECFALLVAGLIAQNLAAAAATSSPQAKVEQAVIDALPAWQGKKAQIVDYLDLTKSFVTTTPWALVVARDARPPPADLAMMGNGSPIVICFVKTLTPSCSEARGHAGARFDMTNGLVTVAVVFAGPGQTRPLLMLQTLSAHGLNGNANIATKLFDYDRKTDRFRKMLVNVVGGTNNNAAARFIGHGPLQGDVIVDYPTDDAPYAYWIEVYVPGKSDRYVRFLRYRSVTRYGDGNPLAVADSEMPEIMERMGLWKPGDALPIPPHAPKGCGSLVTRHGEAWCKALRIASTPQQ